jgi:hypothetical protein
MALTLQSLSPGHQRDLDIQQRKQKMANRTAHPLTIGTSGKAQKAYLTEGEVT